jgi:hypothetical protein
MEVFSVTSLVFKLGKNEGGFGDSANAPGADGDPGEDFQRVLSSAAARSPKQRNRVNNML